MDLPPSSPRQTLRYLRGLLDSRGIHPKSKLGQNFLIDLNLLDLIVRAAELSPEDLVVEIGSGSGGLTNRLAGLARAGLSVGPGPGFFSPGAAGTAGKRNFT